MSLQNILPYRVPNMEGKRLLDPHVVIIGAGASKAACAYDKKGKQIPLLKDIHKVLGLTEMLAQYHFSDAEMQDFEMLYSAIYGRTEFVGLQKELEYAIGEYFRKLEIPDEVTYYDYLILSLTSKDVIISFNWDPFLMQAYRRNLSVGNLPGLIFPHGNAGVGICHRCNVLGYANCLCPNCLKELKQMPLLYPVGQKNYNDKPVIKSQWRMAAEKLERAAGITVYGYGAPITDREVVDLLKVAYSKSHIRDIAPFTIINLPENRDEQMERWAEFFEPRMMLYCGNIEDSLLWGNPRVSLEALFDSILQQHPRAVMRPFSKFERLSELQEFAKTINEFDMYMPGAGDSGHENEDMKP